MLVCSGSNMDWAFPPCHVSVHLPYPMETKEGPSWFMPWFEFETHSFSVLAASCLPLTPPLFSAHSWECTVITTLRTIWRTAKLLDCWCPTHRPGDLLQCYISCWPWHHTCSGAVEADWSHTVDAGTHVAAWEGDCLKGRVGSFSQGYLADCWLILQRYSWLNVPCYAWIVEAVSFKCF